MSSSYFKLQLLLKENQSKKLRSKIVKRNTVKVKFKGPITYYNNEHRQNFDNKCRICLNEGLIPIYEADSAFDVPGAITAISGVEVNQNDEFPNHMCKDCYSLLRGAILFRKSAQESDEILKRTAADMNDCSVLPNEDYHVNDFETFAEPIVNEYKCQTCNLNFNSLEKYKLHRNSKKHKNVVIQCKECHRLLTAQLYKKHLKRHQAASHLVCDICGKLYRKDNLIRHLQLHSNELPFQCQVCPYRGRFMESLKIHMRTHSGDKPFSCDKCELRFITKSNLNRHLMTHIKEKPYNCLECSRGFYTQRDLDTHLKADHSGNKEFGCRLCGNKYGTKKAIMRHELRVHKREKMARGRMPLYLQTQFQNNNNFL